MRRPITWIWIVILVLIAFAGLLTSAQDDTLNPPQLPITADVRYEVGLGDTLDGIAAVFDVDLACLRQSNSIQPTESTIRPGDVLAIRTACPPYAGLNYVPFPRAVEQGGGENTYTIRAGDTLSDIAVAFNIALESLQEYNDIDNPNTIFVGQVIEIPPGAPEYGRVPALDDETLEQGGAEGDIIYVIQPQDTLDVIGAFYNAAPLCIAEANGIANANRITPRTTIVIPAVCAPYVGPNIVGGRILPANSNPTVAPTVVITSTPRPTTVPTVVPATQAPVTAPTPTPEVLEQGGGSERGDSLGSVLDVLGTLTEEIEGDN